MQGEEVKIVIDLQQKEKLISRMILKGENLSEAIYNSLTELEEFEYENSKLTEMIDDQKEMIDELKGV
jgi:hypothetical protein